ncbi:hypothetical protein M3175_07990 [Robertmurraya korlensis]|uniref:hypothetical protein n=1 Tax=Robertmurraya korlensis TaxID=519977 RepID=UPI00203B5C5F|nr:hypothetical protein [Robertmurraya korlensis]MCM3600668.1 hypothetical protein [Robertmurraya korlensis]
MSKTRWDELFDKPTDLDLDKQARILARFFVHLETRDDDSDYEKLKKHVESFQENN